jgi:hypothetical protein
METKWKEETKSGNEETKSGNEETKSGNEETKFPPSLSSFPFLLPFPSCFCFLLSWIVNNRDFNPKMDCLILGCLP